VLVATYSEDFVILGIAVLIQCQGVTYRWTDRCLNNSWDVLSIAVMCKKKHQQWSDLLVFNKHSESYSTTSVLTIKRSPSIARVVDCTDWQHETFGWEGSVLLFLFSQNKSIDPSPTRTFVLGKQGVSKLLPLVSTSVYSCRPWILAMLLSEAVFFACNLQCKCIGIQSVPPFMGWGL